MKFITKAGTTVTGTFTKTTVSTITMKLVVSDEEKAVIEECHLGRRFVLSDEDMSSLEDPKQWIYLHSLIGDFDGHVVKPENPLHALNITGAVLDNVRKINGTIQAVLAYKSTSSEEKIYDLSEE